ncbi:YlxR family protein [Microlunatus speluncae]|uniref:YlxR family protein n=1 Tax=Microlunatus speluncae TaxID=2594267 RepID=UPI0012667829|nr:YlxR family protein [Microlunatus speluncae]
MTEPVRTCVGCRRRADKSTLIRIVRTGADLELDLRQRSPGRGAYLHRELGCLDQAIKKRALGRALRADGIGPDQQAALRTAFEALLG